MTRPERPASPDRPARPTVPAGSTPASVRRRREASVGSVSVARTTVPTCLVMAVLLTGLGVVRLLAGEGSAWRFGETSVGWLLLFSGLVAAGGAVLLMRFVARNLAR